MELYAWVQAVKSVETISLVRERGEKAKRSRYLASQALQAITCKACGFLGRGHQIEKARATSPALKQAILSNCGVRTILSAFLVAAQTQGVTKLVKYGGRVEGYALEQNVVAVCSNVLPPLFKHP